MDPKRQADELAGRCVALIIFHQHVIETRPEGRPIVADIRAIGLEARKAGIAMDAVASGLIAELMLRYEPEKARRLHREFVAQLGEDFRPIPMKA